LHRDACEDFEAADNIGEHLAMRKGSERLPIAEVMKRHRTEAGANGRQAKCTSTRTHGFEPFAGVAAPISFIWLRARV
jgi:hypothetical protein